ncbi:pseudouridine synthase [Sphingobacterium deserti]|uniref:Pseudouridine synthase n=1 Tax=Sphingobacterium deserti TaxID=1229276 RepID=A0A0B8T304_9SPHI|nr:pseudouridine synthase [Sphingobacterium deserti]KGE15812.1 RNA-binding S4 domain-containing protein [Sphingobacterium deserti]
MPFNSKRNSRDDNSKKGRSDERSFGSKSGRNQQSSSKSGSGKTGFDRTERKPSDKPFNKFDKREKRDDERPYNKFDKGERKSADRPFNKFDKGERRDNDRPFNKYEKKDAGRPFNKFDKGERRDGDRPFNKFEKKDTDRGFNKFDKGERRDNDRPFNKFEKKDRRNDGDKGERYPEREKRDRKFSNDTRGFDRSKRPFKRFDDNEENSEIKTFHPRKKIATAEPKDDGLIRLNRYISNAGICSRRKADELITSGVVSVNGEVVTELGTKVDPAIDEIRYNNERLKREKMVYVLLNKPKDYITTTDDPQERRTVMHLVAKATKERIYPVGRLDRNTTGLLLLTNDGNLAEKLSHPRNNVSKIYNVELNKNLTQGDFNKIQFGIELEDGLIKPDDLSYVQGGSKREIGIQIHSGKNRVVRRIFESLGYDVVKLDRVVYANLTKKDLPRGRWRYLEERELVQLKHLIK